MLFCGLKNNLCVRMALDYLPENVQESINYKVAFIMLNSDACRLTSIIRDYKEVIIFSPWVFPYKNIHENDKEVRYYISCVLHEVAHIILKHKSPLNCSEQENDKQESDADNLALKWFNGHISGEISPLSIEEIRDHQERNRRRIELFLGWA